jgi:ferritin
MASKKIVAAINKQINVELYSGYLYFAMSTYCTLQGLKGSAHWLFVQGQEEMTHAWRFYNYVQKLGEPVILQAIAQPPSEFLTPLQLFEEVLKHEQKVTGNINDLVDLATQERDHATQVLLQWFVNEQVEEEENAKDTISQLKLVGKDGSALLLVDRELGARTFVMPPDLAGGTVPVAVA